MILIRLNHCIMFCDPDTFEPLHYVLWPWYVWRVVTFLSLKDLPSQYADEIKNTADAAFNLFNYIYVTVANSIVFFDSDGASVNSGFKKGLAVTLWEAVVPWLVFVWCLSHQLELTLKDSLDEIMRHKKWLTSLCYICGQCIEKLWIAKITYSSIRIVPVWRWLCWTI